MKLFLVCAVLFYTAAVFATCDSDFNSGINEYNFAANYFAKGSTSYQKAVDLSNTPSPVFKTICNHLVDSVTGFAVASDSYLNCSTAFVSATKTCTGADVTQANKNITVCLENLDIAKDNLAYVRDLLEKSCFAGAKRLDNLEQIELLQDIVID